MDRPNVLLLYTDQQRWDTIRAGGQSRIHTPNLDALAEEGALFDRAFCNCPVCMPSRMSMLSGRYPASLGIGCNGIEMPEDVPCLQHMLRPYGYHTANLGKLHFRNHASPFRDHREPHPAYGFDTLVHSDEPGCYDDAYIKWVAERDPEAVPHCRCDTPPAWTGAPVRVHPRDTHQPYVFDGPEALTHTAFVAEETQTYLRRHRDGPFFCVAGFYAPHAPINPPRRFVEMYDPATMPPPRRNENENHGDTDEAQWRKVMAYYYALISHIDDRVGRILATLDELGLREKTLVLFTADHGEYLGDRGRVGKCGPEDASARVPLLVRYPEAFGKAGVKTEIVEAVDLAPTILDWCGVQTPPFVQGRSLRPLLEGKAYAPRRSAFLEYRVPEAGGRGRYKAVRTAEHLYVHHGDGTETLYDLRTDPHQLRDVAGEPAHRDALHALRDELLRRWFETDPPCPKRTAMY